MCLDEEDLKEALPEADTPAANTRSRVGSGQRSGTQEVLMTVMDISGVGYMLTPKSTASRKFPKKFFSKMATAVLDGDTGELLEYRHLMKNPKYKEIWGNSFGNEVGRLTQGMPDRISKERPLVPYFLLSRRRYTCSGIKSTLFYTARHSDDAPTPYFWRHSRPKVKVLVDPKQTVQLNSIEFN